MKVRDEHECDAAIAAPLVPFPTPAFESLKSCFNYRKKWDSIFAFADADKPCHLAAMLSFWEKESFLEYDLIVIGGGIVGLSTACSWKEKFPGKSVLVLESGIFPSGASTRNAGFACYGSAAEILHDIRLMGQDKALDLVEMRRNGLSRLRKRLGDEAIGYEELGGGELILHNEHFETDALEEINKLLRPIFGRPVFSMDEEAPARLGFQVRQIRYFIRNHVEGQIHTGKMMKSLMAKARELGVEMLTGCHAGKPETVNGRWRVSLKKSSIEFSAERVAICTNAFTSEFFPEMDVKPGRGQVLITTPLPDLRFRGIYHFDEGYFYFRNVGDRILFGGGRNLAFEEETTTEIQLNSLIQSRLEEYLRTLILSHGTAFEIEQRWAGIMAFGEEKIPILKDMGNGLALGVRMNGMGVAIGSEIGEKLIEIIR
jgi:glycine/D-amino acid oxidase-like deaminating enzyme